MSNFVAFYNVMPGPFVRLKLWQFMSLVSKDFIFALPPVLRDCCSFTSRIRLRESSCVVKDMFACAFRLLSSFRFIPPLFVLSQHDETDVCLLSLSVTWDIFRAIKLNFFSSSLFIYFFYCIFFWLVLSKSFTSIISRGRYSIDNVVTTGGLFSTSAPRSCITFRALPRKFRLFCSC